MSTTSTTQLATIGHNNDSAHADTTYIPLHGLCGNCTKTFERNDGAQQMEASNSPIFRLCTFAHLFIYHPMCHLCTFLFATLERNGKHYENVSEESNIYIQFDHDQQSVNIGLGDTMPAQLPGDSFIAAFELKKYLCQCIKHQFTLAARLITSCRLRE